MVSPVDPETQDDFSCIDTDCCPALSINERKLLQPFHSNPAGICLPNGVLQVLDFCHTRKPEQHFENGIGEPRGLRKVVSVNNQVFMPLGNSGTIDQRLQLDKIDSELSYSSSLEAAVNLILGDPVFVSETATPSLKFFRAARFLKENAPHAFQIREMGAPAQNSMDRWLWDLLEWKIDDTAL